MQWLKLQLAAQCTLKSERKTSLETDRRESGVRPFDIRTSRLTTFGNKDDRTDAIKNGVSHSKVPRIHGNQIKDDRIQQKAVPNEAWAINQKMKTSATQFTAKATSW